MVLGISIWIIFWIWGGARSIVGVGVGIPLEVIMAKFSGHCHNWRSWGKHCLVCHTKTRWTKQYYGYSTHQHTHIFTLCEELSKCSFLSTISSSFSSNTGKFGQIPRDIVTRGKMTWGIVGSREEKVSLLMLFFCGVNPCAWLTRPSLRVLWINHSWGSWLKNVVIATVPTWVSHFSLCFASPAPSILPLVTWIKCQPQVIYRQA